MSYDKYHIKNLLITFDYELFLGKKSGSVEKCVIEPTNKIFQILAEFSAKAIFFIDTAWLVRLKQVAVNYPEANKSYEKVMSQLQDIVKKGHYIFNHLHPHWLHAQYLPEINQWDLSDFSYYRFSNLNKEDRTYLFAETSRLLTEILMPLGSSHKTDGYRAGGWSIQPFNDFKPYFEQYGIKYDFSVLPGMKSLTTAQQYDFTGITKQQPYKFSSAPDKPESGNFTEFPITAVRIPLFAKLLNRLLLKYFWMNGDRSAFDGIGVSSAVLEKTRIDAEMASMELINIIKLPIYLKFLRKHSYMQLISHPKMLTAYNLRSFELFLKKAFTSFKIETDVYQMLLD